MTRELDRTLRTGRLMKKILRYLDRKTDENSPESILDLSPYATAKEISAAIGEDPVCVCHSLSLLLKTGRIRIYENGHKRNMEYGSLKLPQVKREQILEVAMSLKAN